MDSGDWNPCLDMLYVPSVYNHQKQNLNYRATTVSNMVVLLLSKVMDNLIAMDMKKDHTY